MTAAFNQSVIRSLTLAAAWLPNLQVLSQIKLQSNIRGHVCSNFGFKYKYRHVTHRKAVSSNSRDVAYSSRLTLFQSALSFSIFSSRETQVWNISQTLHSSLLARAIRRKTPLCRQNSPAVLRRQRWLHAASSRACVSRPPTSSLWRPHAKISWIIEFRNCASTIDGCGSKWRHADHPQSRLKTMAVLSMDRSHQTEQRSHW
jgi:hypothetical protein